MTQAPQIGERGRRAARTAPAARQDGKPSLRERNKLSKERLIRAAARSLFAKKGYAATTLREVAEKADVGFGTVSAYAADKAGLLAMVYVEELTALPALFDDSPKHGDPMDELIEGLAKLYVFWSKIPKLSHQVLQQMEFFGDNPHMEMIVERRREAQRELAAWIAQLQRQGRMIRSVNADEAAATLFAVYTSAVRHWSATAPGDIAAGLKDLRRLMKLPMQALAPSGSTRVAESALAGARPVN